MSNNPNHSLHMIFPLQSSCWSHWELHWWDSDVGVQKWVKIQKSVKLGSQNKTEQTNWFFKLMLKSRVDCMWILSCHWFSSVNASSIPLWSLDTPWDYWSVQFSSVAGMWSQGGFRKHHYNKASGCDGIPVELFHILKDDAMKVLHSTCQQIWKTQQWPQDWKRSVFIPIPKKGNPKECSNYRTIALISHASKVMLKIL